MLFTRLVQLFVFVISHAIAVQLASNKKVGLYNPAMDKAFCPVKCGRHVKGVEDTKVDVHVACDCKSQHVKTCVRYQEESIPDFRLAMTVAHNKLRNQVAAGTYDEDKGLPPSSNMNAVSYSLALEYSAACSANSCKEELNLCIRIHDIQFVAQNQYSVTAPAKPSKDFVDEAVNKWFSTIDKTQGKDIIVEYAEGDWEAATAMLWSSVTSIGCAINHVNESNANEKILIVCNYGGSQDINVKGDRVYRKGTVCSQCEQRARCNGEFSALCGAIADVPTAILQRGGLVPIYDISWSGKFGTPLESKQYRIRENEIFLTIILIAINVVHF